MSLIRKFFKKEIACKSKAVDKWEDHSLATPAISTSHPLPSIDSFVS